MNMQELFCKCCHELYMKLRSEDVDTDFNELMDWAVDETKVVFDKALNEFWKLEGRHSFLCDEDKKVHVVHHNLNNCLD